MDTNKYNKCTDLRTLQKKISPHNLKVLKARVPDADGKEHK